MKDKIIWIPEDWHKEIKAEASNRGLTIKAYVYNCHKRCNDETK